MIYIEKIYEKGETKTIKKQIAPDTDIEKLKRYGEARKQSGYIISYSIKQEKKEKKYRKIDNYNEYIADYRRERYANVRADVPKEIWSKALAYCMETDMSRQKFVIEAIREKVERIEKKREQ